MTVYDVNEECSAIPDEVQNLLSTEVIQLKRCELSKQSEWEGIEPNWVRLKVNLCNDSDPGDYVSKVRLYLTSSLKESVISTHLIYSDQEGNQYTLLSNNGYWLFSPPQLLKEFIIDMHWSEPLINKNLCNMVEVLRPSVYGERIHLPVQDNIKIDSQVGALEECRKFGASLSSTGYPDSWIGLISSEDGPRLDDGGYSAGDGRGYCHGFNNIITCRTVSCSVTDVEYYTKEYSAEQSLVDSCREGRGTPVLPSSSAEINLALAAFPARNLIVASCEEDAKEWEQTIPKRESDFFDCFTNKGVILTANGTLENCNFSGNESETKNGTYLIPKVLCKRLPESAKQTTMDKIESSDKNGNSRILFDGDLSTVFDPDDSSPFIEIPAIKEAKEIRIFSKYVIENENTYALLKITKICRKDNQETSKYVNSAISLSSEKSKKFHQLSLSDVKTFNCDILEGADKVLKIEWPRVVGVTEVQVIREVIELSLTMANDTGLKLGSSVEITCTVRGSPYLEVTWSCSGGQTCLNNHVTAEYTGGTSEATSWVSVWSVTEQGLFSCKAGSQYKSFNVNLANTCDTLDLPVFKNGYFSPNSKMKIGERVSIKCEEGFNQIATIECDKGGFIYIENLVGNAICIGKMAEAMKNINKNLRTGDLSELSAILLDSVKNQEFLSNAEIDTSIEFLKNISKESYDDNIVLSDIFQASGIISKKGVKGAFPSLKHVQACLEVIDLIGRHSKDPLNLGGDGIALSSADIEGTGDDITFVMYNNTTIDNLKIYDWPVETSSSADAISLPRMYSRGRVWFTVYDKNVFLTSNTASYIIGANVNETSPSTLPPFIANITLRKLYSGKPHSARCVFWDKAAETWSTEGVVKIRESSTHVTCQTSHLTGFSILMTRDDSFIPSTHEPVLSFLSVAGCLVSSICLVLTVIGLLRFPHIRKTSVSIIHVNFSVSLLGALLVFLIMVDMTQYPAACKAGAVSLHYLLLVTAIWTFCEAFNLLLSSRSVFTSYKHVVLMMLFAWFCPMVIVGFTVLTSASPLDNYCNEKVCWLNEKAVISMFAAPAIIIALINLVIYILVLKQYVRNAQSRKANTVSDLRSCFLLLIVLGCTWALGFFTLLTETLLFQYLFTMSNSMQGFCIFYCYCASKPHIIAAWKSGKDSEELKEKEVTMESTIIAANVSPPAPKNKIGRIRAPIKQFTGAERETEIPSDLTATKPPTVGGIKTTNNWYVNDDEYF